MVERLELVNEKVIDPVSQPTYKNKNQEEKFGLYIIVLSLFNILILRIRYLKKSLVYFF